MSRLSEKKAFNVAVVGATGAVGREMIKVLEEREFPVEELRLLASARSEGKRLEFKGREIAVQTLTKGSFDGIDIALFSAGGSRSKAFAPAAVKAGAVVIDNTSAFRMDPATPLVVPEVNPEDIAAHQGIIANPNCSTIQMVVALKPLHDAATVTRVVVTTFQSVSGAGARATDEMYRQSEAVLRGEAYANKVFPHQIAFNCIPQIPQAGAFRPDGFTSEEMKMVDETRKIMHAPQMRICATTVRVPVDRGHAESVNVEIERPMSVEQARALLSTAPGVVVIDDPDAQQYPLQTFCAGKDPVYVGRIRQDPSCERGLVLWVVSDNLRKGAALNAVQIAERLAGIDKPLCVVA